MPNIPADIIILCVGAVLSALMIGILWKLHHQNHPKALWLLFFTEMWERFSFYGMRALLVLYMVNVMKVGDTAANLQYGGYMALVYTMPLIGGWIADSYLGARKSIILGGLLMAAGHLSLAVPLTPFFYLGLGFLISGNGFFKPNISSLLGRFYEANDPRKDTAFSIFYLGINVGAFLGSTLCGYLGEKVDWHLGFGIAGAFMILGLVVFLKFRSVLGDLGLPPRPEAPQPAHRVWIGLALGIVPIGAIMVYYYKVTSWVMPVMGTGAFAYVVWLGWNLSNEMINGPAATGTLEERCRDAQKMRQKLWAALILMVCSVTFWAFFEQSGGSFNLMTVRNVDLNVGGSELSGAMLNNNINPAFIILLTPVFAWLWGALVRMRKEPSAPVKFGISFLFMAVGFWMIVLGGQAAGETGLIPLVWFIAAYMFITCSELCISPIGLSVVSKLSPARMTGLLMGMWFLATAFGHGLAGFIGTLMAVPKGDHGASLTAVESLPIYTNVCGKVALVSVAGGIILIAVSPLIKRWMHGVK